MEKVKEWYKSFTAIAEKLVQQTATINFFEPIQGWVRYSTVKLHHDMFGLCMESTNHLAQVNEAITHL